MPFAVFAFFALPFMSMILFIRDRPDFFFNSAFWAMLSAWAAIGVTFVAWNQISAIREQISATYDQTATQIEAERIEHMKQRALNVCQIYDFDPTLFAVRQKLDEAWENGDLRKNPQIYRTYMVTILNYLDGIATGVRTHVYDEDISRQHIRTILFDSCDCYFDDALFPCPPAEEPSIFNDYPNLVWVMEQWADPKEDERIRIARPKPARAIAEVAA